ncbi:MAG: small-conductance mechanosensitive channel [Oleiphilaceae bacterium]|jgi:small-conductance mechanosensitive channel
MSEVASQASSFFTDVNVYHYFRALLLIAAGFLIARVVSAYAFKLTARFLDAQAHMMLRRAVYSVILVIFFMSALLEMGFNLSVLLGAAGVFSVAIGFASQTSASNLISGLFLMAEKPFTIGDVIKVDDIVGEVLSIDMLSVKVRTYDNLYVRLPNESLIKSKCTTITRFPIRRQDMMVGVAYKEDIQKVKKVLFDVAEKNPLCLEEPKPVYIFLSYGDSSINIQFSVWATKTNFLEMKNSMYEQVKEAFDRENIEIPFPHRTLYTGAVTTPFPVELQEAKTNSESAKPSSA